MLMFFCIVVRKTYAVRRKGELKMITKSFERKLEKLGAFEIFECRKRKS